MDQLSSSRYGSAYHYTPYQRVDPGLKVPNDGAKYGVSVYTNELAVEGRSRPLSLLRSFRWWLIEILASLVSVAAFAAIVFVVRHYQGRGVQEVNLPSSLTLNGLIALLSTVNRVALMVPVASALSQEVWTWLCESGGGPRRRRQLRDLELSDAASRGAWGSFKFLFQTRRR